MNLFSVVVVLRCLGDKQFGVLNEASTADNLLSRVFKKGRSAVESSMPCTFPTEWSSKPLTQKHPKYDYSSWDTSVSPALQIRLSLTFTRKRSFQGLNLFSEANALLRYGSDVNSLESICAVFGIVSDWSDALSEEQK